MQSAKDMIAGGVHIIDIGGQSTRPGAAEGTEAQELARVLPVVRLAVPPAPHDSQRVRHQTCTRVSPHC